jgi:HlyD family secretion protein
MAAGFGFKCAVAGDNTPAPPVVAVPVSILGVGAIGLIEPRSRVIKLSHDQGPDGARVQKILVEEGQSVEAGAPLVIFSDYGRRESELKIARAQIKAMEARLSGTKAELVDAEADYKRYQSLLGSAAISRASYDKANARFKKAKSDLNVTQYDIEVAKNEAALSEQKLAQSTLLAPINGTVLKIYTRVGERVRDDNIMEFADLTQMDIVAEVYENDIDRIKIGQSADVTLQGVNKIYKAIVRERSFLVQKNDLNDTDPLADRDNRVIDVRLTLDDAAIQDLKNQIFRQVNLQIKP